MLMQISRGLLDRAHRKNQLLKESALNGHFKYTYVTLLVRMLQLGKLDLSRFFILSMLLIFLSVNS